MKRAVLGGLNDAWCTTLTSEEKQMNGKPKLSADNVKSFGNLVKLLFDANPGLVKTSEVGKCGANIFNIYYTCTLILTQREKDHGVQISCT